MGRASRVIPVTIASGASLSGAVPLRGWDLVAVKMPAAWTAAGITIQASDDGTDFTDVFTSAGTETTLTVTADDRVQVPVDAVRGARAVKIRSGTAAVPVNQAADRIVSLVVTR